MAIITTNAYLMLKLKVYSSVSLLPLVAVAKEQNVGADGTLCKPHCVKELFHKSFLH